MSTNYCRHFSCQCDAAAELAVISEALERADLLLSVVEIFEHNLEVRCRHVARRGAIADPFPMKEPNEQ